MHPELAERNKSTMRIVMPSLISSVGQTIRDCEDFMNRHDGGESVGASVVLRELLTNAVVHGNQNAGTRRVGVTVEYLGTGRFRLQVEDEGNGFDVSSVDMSLPEDPRELQKRGYILINSLSDRLEFNDKGNRVTAYVTVPEKDHERPAKWTNGENACTQDGSRKDSAGGK